MPLRNPHFRGSMLVRIFGSKGSMLVRNDTFGTGFQKSWRAARSAPSSKSDNRRSTSELAALRGQLYEAVLAKPGETIAVLALAMNSSAQELKFPMKQPRRMRS